MTMKFRAHDTFFIRKGWLSKGMERVVAKDDLFVDKNENPMDVLGIGSNMVKALRYWLQAVGLTKEATKGKRVHHLDMRFLRMISLLKNWERFIYCSISLLSKRKRLLHGTISSMFFQCRNLQGKNLFRDCRIIY